MKKYHFLKILRIYCKRNNLDYNFYKTLFKEYYIELKKQIHSLDHASIQIEYLGSLFPSLKGVKRVINLEEAPLEIKEKAKILYDKEYNRLGKWIDKQTSNKAKYKARYSK